MVLAKTRHEQNEREGEKEDMKLGRELEWGEESRKSWKKG